jgi:ribonuclease E
MKKEMLINVLQPEECRIAIVENGQLEELYVERASQESYVGNIYKGKIVNIEASIQAAFVDFGIGRNGFLHISDVDPAYYKHLLSKEDLAAYEEEMDREHGVGGGGGTGGKGRDRDRGGKGRDRDRGGKGRDRDRGPREMTSFLGQPQPAARRDELLHDDDFAAGLDEGAPSADSDTASDDEIPVAEVAEETEVFEAAEVNEPAEPAEAVDAVAAGDADDFAAGLEVVPVAEAPIEPAPAPKAPVPVADDDDFAAGLVEDAAAAVTMAEAIEALEGGDPVAPVEAPESDNEEKKKPRTRRAKPAEGDGEPKPRARRKKKDDESDDDKPRVMPGAERRTRAGDDDEGEIKPFFDDAGGSPDFDPDAPNDRFADAPADGTSAEHLERFTEDPEPAEAAEEEAREFAHEAEGAAEPAEAEVTGRGFNDDFESNKRDRGERNDRGDRGRGRGGRDRDRDRGPRGGERGDRFKSGGGPKGGRDRGLPKPKIQDVFKKGQEVIVQVIKEAVGTKGPTLSTYISIAGRYLVLMPSLNRVGVSRKIEDHDARRRLREIMSTLAPPKGVGFIVRTAAIDRDAKELQNDLAYLLRLWQVVVKRLKRVQGPCEIYRESDMITRTIRDIFTADIDTIWVDEANAFAHASEFLQIVMPKFASRIRHFEHTEPLFHKYGVEDEIGRMYSKRIEMPLGGSLVIEQTEALVAIDVNSGNFRADNNAEETAFQMNLHAAKEIARQLRLRDLGGVIVNDFIDMKSESHRRRVEDAFRDALRRDRARTKILRISQFGLIEMTRQRIRPSLKRSIFADCPHCRGNGFVKTSESLAIEVMRLLQLAAHRAPAIQSVQVSVSADAANYLLNKRRRDLAALEEHAKIEITISGVPGLSPEALSVRCFDHSGNEVRLIPLAAPKLSGGRFPQRDDRRSRFERRGE